MQTSWISTDLLYSALCTRSRYRPAPVHSICPLDRTIHRSAILRTPHFSPALLQIIAPVISADHSCAYFGNSCKSRPQALFSARILWIHFPFLHFAILSYLSCIYIFICRINILFAIPKAGIIHFIL